MAYHVRCRCGKLIPVRPSMAGATVRCQCGQNLVVPSLNQLSHQEIVEADSVPEASLDESLNDWEPAPPLPGDDESNVLLLTSEDKRRERIDETAFIHFVVALVRIAESCIDAANGRRPLSVQVAFALLPEGKRLMQIDAWPACQSTEVCQRLRSELEAMAAPPVENGPVAILARLTIGRGAPTTDAFPIPFERFLHGEMEPSMDEVLMRAAGLPVPAAEPETDPQAKRRWWARFWPWQGRSKPSPMACSGPATANARKASEQQEQTDLLRRLAEQDKLAPIPEGELNEETLNDLIQFYPDDPRLYGMRGDVYNQQDQLQRAVADYSELIRRLPKKSAAYLVRAECYYHLSELHKALADVNEILRMDEQHAGALALRGAIYWQLGAYDQSLLEYEAAIQAAPRCPAWYIARAQRLAERGQLEVAIADCDAAVALDPHDPHLRTIRAMLVLQQSRIDETISTNIKQIVADCTWASKVDPAASAPLALRAEANLAAGLPDAASKDCEQAMERDEDCALAYAVRGQIRYRQQRFEDAEADSSRAIELGMAEPRVFLCRAEARAMLDDVDRAIEDCELAIELAPETPEPFGLMAQIYLQQGKFDAAIHAANTAIECAADWYVPYTLRGCARLGLDDFDEALTDLNHALRLAPDDVHALYHRGVALHRAERLDEAIEDFTRVLEIDDEHVEAYFQRSVLWLEKRELDKALMDIEEVLLREPDYMPAYFNRGNLLRMQGDLDGAMRDFNAVIELSPTMASAYSCRGDVWIEKGNCQRAEEDYDQAIRLEPEAAGHFHLQRLLTEAAYCQRKHRFGKAISLTTEALREEPDFIPALLIRAAAYWYSEQHVEAADDYTRVVELNGDTFSALNGRGQVYAEMGEYELALRDLNRALTLEGVELTSEERAYALNGRGLAYAGMERYEEARSDFTASMRICPDNAWLYYNQGLMHHQRGETDRAAECFRIAVDKKSPPLPPRKRRRALAYGQN